MNTKFLIAGISAFIVFLGGSFIVHGILLHEDYAQLPNLFRTEADARVHFPFMLLSHLLRGFACAWIYRQGITPGIHWLAQGIRFGIAVALLFTVPIYLIYYSVQPMPGILVAKQIVLEYVVTILMGVVVAFVSKPAASEA
jgi:hypothetical protein